MLDEDRDLLTELRAGGALPGSIDDLLTATAARVPDATALNLFDRGVRYTYGELRVAVSRFADGLHRLGVRHGDHVAVMLPNRAEFPIAWLALAQLGAVMVPVVLSSTAREVEFFLRDSQSRFLIVEAGALAERGLAPGEGSVPPDDRVVLVGDAGARGFDTLVATGRADFAPPRRPAADDLLNIQYTSGTSGLPKGVMLTHRYWTICAASAQLFYDMPFRSMLAESPFFYMDSQWMLVAVLLCGGRLDIAERPSIARFVDRLHDHQTEVAWFTEQVLKNPRRDEERATGIKLFLGYHQSPLMIEQAADRFGAPVRELYGSTEAGSILGVPLHVEDDRVIGTCGVPQPYRRVRVVRDDGTECGDGEAGELWVSGEGMMLGYWNRPEANAELLVDGWFRTGDLFVRSPEGYYSIVGRLKDMVRRSGENIAAIEVEQVLMDMPEIAFAAIVPVPDPHRQEEIKAYVQPVPGADVPSHAAMIAHCREYLAAFKVPRYWATVAAFPFTASEKIAKHQLTAGVTDLREGAWDAVDNIQR